MGNNHVVDMEPFPTTRRRNDGHGSNGAETKKKDGNDRDGRDDDNNNRGCDRNVLDRET